MSIVIKQVGMTVTLDHPLWLRGEEPDKLVMFGEAIYEIVDHSEDRLTLTLKQLDRVIR